MSHAEHLVIGPPGCGKTTYLSRQSGLAGEKYGFDSVLISSLTRAAAEEVASRNTGLHPDRIGTLHSHAFKTLDRPDIAEGPDGLKAWNEYLLDAGWPSALQMDPRGGDADVEWKPAEARMRGVGMATGEDLLQRLGIYRARMVPKELWNPTVAAFSERWEEFKTSTGMLDFTDLIERAIAESQWAPGRPKVIMLDEAQDMSKLEFTLARKWAAACEQTVTVGDADQCLYSWRGTDPEAMLHHDFASRNVLSRSWRVPEQVRAYASAWIERVEGREPVEYKARYLDPERPEKGEAQGELRFANHSWRRPEGVIDLVRRDLERGESAMILASCSYMLEPTIAVLREAGIPFHNPYRPTHGGWNPMRGARRLLTYLQPSTEAHGEHAREWNWTDVETWLGPMRVQGRLVRGVKTRIEELARSRPDQEITLVELRDLFLSGEDFERALNLDVPWWAGSLLEKDAKVARYPSKIYTEHGAAALREQPMVTVGTIHSVKGGEADSVYVWPDLSRAGWEADWENPAHRAPIYRLFYVAFTRARERLTLMRESTATAVVFPREP